jgi:hypothetical protein
MRRIIFFTCALLAALPCIRPAPAAEQRPVVKEQLLYEITVTAPGTRSQGWHGTLYNANGQPMQVAVGKTETTVIGELVSVAAVSGQRWQPYGMIPVKPGMTNDIMPDAWSYKLYRTGIDTRCPSWRGELLRGDIVVTPQTGSKQVQTSMGQFIWATEPHGWIHKSWNVEVVRCG